MDVLSQPLHHMRGDQLTRHARVQRDERHPVGGGVSLGEHEGTRVQPRVDSRRALAGLGVPLRTPPQPRR